MRRSVVAGAILALVQVVPALAQTGAPPGSIGIRLLEAPKELADDPRARLYVIDHLNQGDTIRRRIEVSSGLDDPVRLKLYAAGAVVSKGRFGFLDDRTQNELSSWIAVDPPSVEVRPNGSATAVVTIAVPKDAADGERYASCGRRRLRARRRTGVSPRSIGSGSACTSPSVTAAHRRSISGSSP